MDERLDAAPVEDELLEEDVERDDEAPGWWEVRRTPALLFACGLPLLVGFVGAHVLGRGLYEFIGDCNYLFSALCGIAFSLRSAWLTFERGTFDASTVVPATALCAVLVGGYEQAAVAMFAFHAGGLAMERLVPDALDEEGKAPLPVLSGRPVLANTVAMVACAVAIVVAGPLVSHYALGMPDVDVRDWFLAGLTPIVLMRPWAPVRGRSWAAVLVAIELASVALAVFHLAGIGVAVLAETVLALVAARMPAPAEPDEAEGADEGADEEVAERDGSEEEPASEDEDPDEPEPEDDESSDESDSDDVEDGVDDEGDELASEGEEPEDAEPEEAEDGEVADEPGPEPEPEDENLEGER